MRILSILFGTLLSSACSDSPDPVTEPQDNNPASNSSSGPESLYGGWIVPCYSIGSSGRYFYSEFTFSSQQFIREDYDYEATDDQCSNPYSLTITTYDISYLAEQQTTSLGEAIKADLIPVAYELTIESETLWNSDTDGIPVDVQNEYMIYINSDNKLYFGDISSGEGNSAESRPTKIDVASGFFRK